MGDKSKIEWTEATWNPTTGCDRISPGCDNCYALTLAARLKAMGAARYQNDGHPATSGPGFAVTTHPDVLDLPLRWTKPRRVFVNSMSDLFHARIPRQFAAEVFARMALARRHTFQILTKRPERARMILTDRAFLHDVHGILDRIITDRGHRRFDLTDWDTRPGDGPAWIPPWPLPNVWMGTSVENQRVAAQRIPELIATPAALRWLSLEPLIEPVVIPWMWRLRLHWAVIGGESGPGARPMEESWVLALIQAFEDADVPVFVKQMGTVWARDMFVGGRSVAARGDRKGADSAHWDPLLRARDYPEDQP